MKKYLPLSLLIVSLVISGCLELKEDYSMFSSFSSQVTTQTTFNVSGNKVELSLPFADFSCQPEMTKSVLSRQGNIFTVYISGEETQERCAQTFSATISGLKSGSYQLKIIYNNQGNEQQVFYKEFTIDK